MRIHIWIDSVSFLGTYRIFYVNNYISFGFLSPEKKKTVVVHSQLLPVERNHSHCGVINTKKLLRFLVEGNRLYCSYVFTKNVTKTSISFPHDKTKFTQAQTGRFQVNTLPNLMSKAFEIFSIKPLCIYHCSPKFSIIYFKYSASCG